jgi:FAD/FMN-containing dehydrogenase
VVGNLRSYGDEVLNSDGHYLQTTRCDRILELDTGVGAVTVEAGVTLDTLQRRFAPLGFMLPVTPGTAFITVGGAIANDVHGKNQGTAGTFGCHVDSLQLARTDGALLNCSRSENAEIFAATLGGMGLTGAITRARLSLRRITSTQLRVDSRRFANLHEFFELDARAHAAHEYNVAWIDCLATGAALGRGVYSSADHLTQPRNLGGAAVTRRTSVPFSPPISPINRATLSLLNRLYWRTHAIGAREIDYMKWLYPLDSIGHWNRLYGRAGFRQFQCVVPTGMAREAIGEMLRATASFGEGSFLAVLKNFGARPSPGLMSFPMPGTTLALDFPHRPRTVQLLAALHAIALDAGGRIYAAKDSCAPAASLARGYPNLERFRRSMDPGLSSVLARRLELTS